MTHSNNLKVLAGSILLAGGLQSATAQTKVTTMQEQSQQQTLQALSGPERAQRHLAELKQQAVYDETTKASYVFSKPLQDDYLDALMQKENIYYADSHSLVVQIDDESTLATFQKAGFDHKKIADRIYSISVSQDIQATKTLLEKTAGVNHVTYNYFLSPLVGGATYWNDPGIWHDSGSIIYQNRLTDESWVNRGYKNIITQSVDSIEAVKVFHDATKVNVHVIDLGINTASPEYNLKEAHNIETGTTGNIQSAHGNAVSADAVGILNNNYGGGGVAPGFALFSYDAERSGMPGYLTSNFIIAALQKIYDYSVAHPDEINLVNMSFGATNDPIIYELIKKIQGLKNGTQNFLAGASGNSGNVQPVSYPARYDEVFAIGASKANTATRALRDGTHVDNTLDFVIDGAGGAELYSTDGSLVQSNGTSFAAPKFGGLLAQLHAQREGASSSNAVSGAGDLLDMDEVRAKVKKGAVKTGEMNGVELRYPSAWRVLRERVVEDLPDNVDAQNNPNFKINFTPKFYNTNNVTMQKNRKMLYPNGQLVPSSVDPTTGLITFHITFTTNNGFVNGKPARLAYQFTGFTGDQKKEVLVDIPKVITPYNVASEIDQNAPVATLNGSAVITVPFGGTYTELGAKRTDNIDGSGNVTTPNSGSVNTNVVGTYILQYRYTDKAGNKSNVLTRTVNVVDQNAPVATLNGGAVITIPVGGEYTELGANRTDNVDGSGSVSTPNSGTVNTNQVGTYTLQYRYTDKAGNKSNVLTRTVNVVDQNAPVATLNGSTVITIPVGGEYTELGAKRTDNIDGSGTVATPNSGSVNTNAVGTYILQYRYTDKAGNKSNVLTRTVNVVDQNAPVATLNGSTVITVPFGGVYTELGATRTDNIDGSGNVTTPNSGSVNTNVVGTYVLQYRYTDEAGNKSNVLTRTVNVVDQTAPIVALNGDTIVTLEQGGTYTELGATRTDNIDGSGNVTTPNSGSVDANVIGTYILEYRYTDKAGNKSNVLTRTVNVTKINSVGNVSIPKLVVRPNPVARELHIPLATDVSSVGVQVSSITGQQLKATIVENTGNQIILPVDDLSEGIYILTLTTNKGEKIGVAKFTKGK